ncbi:MAG: DNA repair protein RadC [Eubacteriales bacterium]|nr:DNA repair protein RadC [Eubacteriales bacterium]
MKELPSDLRPYEKCLKYGADALSDTELLAVIIKNGTKNNSAIMLADELINYNNSDKGIANLMYLTREEYRSVKGIGDVKATELLCICELSKRLWRREMFKGHNINSPNMAASYYMEELKYCNQERVYIMLLDTRSVFLKSVMIAKGTVNLAVISPREIFYEALIHRAAAFILIHNHPSGNADPSKEDIVFAEKLKELGSLMNIPLRDSIIIGNNCYISMLEKELI